ncbi:hypothetical protein ACFE04_020054 [Oxalis oulophora]
MDEELLKLSIVDHIQKLGLAEHFRQDIDRILAEAYRNYKNKEYSSESRQQEIRQHVENDPEYFSSVMLDVFKATELMFLEETEFDEARWTMINGLSDLGFGRERTTYCYFAIASCDSFGASLRMMVSKLAILITVADDLYDAKGSIHELRALTDAIRRWDGIGLTGHSKTIFKALDSYMTLIAANHQQQHGIDISYYHRAIVSA